MSSFLDSVREFNKIYELENIPLDEMITRQVHFLKIIKEEIEEGEELHGKLVQEKIDPLDSLVEMADWLGDIIVYCTSEALRYNIPIADVLKIIMDSNRSKLGEDGRPIHNPETGKVMKGPHYWKPEGKIKELLMNHHGNQTS